MRGSALAGASGAACLLVLQVAGVLTPTSAGYVVMGVMAGSLFMFLIGRHREPGDPSAGPRWLDISESAVSHVRFRGNRLYVWAETVGGGFGQLRCSTDRPLNMEFDEVASAPVRVHVTGDFDFRTLRVRLRSWPNEHLSIDGGEAWGDGGG
ncbi:MAG TPA: hypothetical protein VFJ78_08930 [Gaiellaceae bacterium]|nr:hypothetical protein [Gaiellaceae bacterium]